MEQKEDKCPRCGSGRLSYGQFHMDGPYKRIDVECVECGFDGRMWYKLVFDGWQEFDGVDQYKEVIDE